MLKASPLKQFDKFEVLSGVSEEVKKHKEEKEEKKRKEEEEIKTVAEEQQKKEEEENKLEEEKKIQEDTTKYQTRIDAGEITVEQAQKEYKEQIKKEEEEKVTVIKDGKKLSWEQAKEDDKLYDSLTLNEKRKLARGKNLKDIKELGEDITAAPEKSNIDNKPGIAKDLLAHIGRGWTSSAKGVSNQVEAMQFGLASLALNPKTKEEKIALHSAVKNVNQSLPGSASIPDSKYNSAMKMFDANIRKYENESITEDLRDGNYAQAGFRTVGAALESMPSLVAAYTGFGGLGVLAASVSGNKFEEEFEKNPEESTGRLLLNAGGTGILESTFELVTRGVMKRAGLLAGEGKVKAAKELLAGGSRNLAKNMTMAVGGGALSESATEASSLLLEAMPKSFPGGLGRDIVWKDHFYELADAGIVGSFVDGSISTVGAVNNGNQKAIDRAEVILAPKDINDRLNEKIHIINKLAEDLPTASKEGKELINERIENEYQEVIKIKKENSVALQNLEGESLQDYATNKEQIDKNVELAQKSTNDSEKQEALNRVTKLTEVNKSILDVAKKKAYKKDIETITKQASTYFGDKVEVVEADTQEKSAELLETSIHERRIALEEELKSIEDQNSGPAVKIKEEIDDLKADLKDIRNLKKQPGQQSLATGAYFSHGYITPADQGGRRKIIVNKEAALKAGFVTTGQHEFVHAILNETIKDSPDIQVALGEALGAHLGVIDKGEIKDSEYRQRIYDYIKSPVNARAEEMLPLLSEAMSRKDLKFDEGIFTGLKDKFRQYFQKIGLIDIEFNSGRDVYNFIKDFNKSVATGKTNEAIQKLARKGAKGKLIKGEKGTPIIKQSKEASEKVQSIYDKKGVAGAFDIIEQFKPIVGKIVQRRSEAPNFDRQLLTDEIETGKRGIYDLIKEYKPESGVPLAAYINTYLPSRAIEASRRVLGEEFTEDVSERVDIAAEEVDVEITTKPKKKKTILSDRLGVKGKVDKAIKEKLPELDVENLNFKTLKDQTPEITGKMFGISPKKLISGANITKKELQSAQMFISKNSDVLLAMLPEGSTTGGTATGVPNTLLKAFYIKTGRAKMEKTGTKAGLAVQVKNDNISKNDFLEVFGIVDGIPNRTDRNTSARVLALANQTGKMMTNQAVREQLLEQGKPLQAIQHIGDGKSAIMFSKSLRDIGINQQVIFWDGLSEVAAKTNPSLKNYLDKKDIKDILKEVYVDQIKDSDLGKIADDIVGYLKLYQPTISRNKTKNQTQWTEFAANSFAEEANNIIKMLNLEIDGVPVKFAGDLYDNINNVQQGRRVFVEVSNVLLEKYGPEKAARMVALLKGMHANNAKVGRGMFKTDLTNIKNPKVVPVKLQKGEVFGRGRNQLFESVPAFNAYVGQIQGKDDKETKLFKEAYKNQKPLYAQTSAAAIKDKDYSGRLKEAQEARQLIDDVMNALDNDLDVAMFMISNLSSMKTPLRRAANLEYISDSVLEMNPKNLGKLAEYEHIIPANQMALRIIDAYKNKGGIKNLNDFYKNYNVAIIPKTMDDVLKLQNLQSKMLAGHNFDTDPSFNRYYNFLTNGFDNMVSIRNINTNEVIGPRVKFSKSVNKTKTLNKAIQFSRSTNNPTKGITVLDFDDTLATTKSNILTTAPDGTKGKMNAEEYASNYEDLAEQGYTFDFSEFNKVVKGKKAPLFEKALKLQGKFGPENMFVLTARPPQAAKAIFDFLKANGLNIPIKNITGLANSTAEAKALWIAEKVGDGYNDFYFADDAMQNVTAVKNMLDQFDVKSKVQQAKVKFSKDLSPKMNDILEQTTGVKSEKVFSDAQAKIRGAKTKYKSIIPASAQDFKGLLYNFIGKGKKGEADLAFFKEALIDPFARGISELNTSRQNSANDYKNLQKAFPEVKKIMSDKVGNTEFNNDQAARVYLWNKAGFEVPGLSKRDLKTLVEHVQATPGLQAFAEGISLISKKENGYSKPGDFWLAENITSDLLSDGSIGDARADVMAEWQQNIDVMFSPENLNKIEAIYGSNFREALEDSIYRMRTGRNRPAGGGRIMNSYMNWVNNSVGAIMFFNMRSAILQTISATNYINWSFNNPAKAAMAFANQPQYWKDFSMLFNSPYLKQRRSGNQRGINEAELSAAVAGAENKAKAAIAWLLKKGFLPTQLADSFAIASGGATFFRNKVKALVKEGMTQEQAEKQAFLAFQETTEVSQQSARPDMISQQQASPLGRLILSFQNTPMQYARIMNKAARDLVNGRGDTKTHLSKIAYYGVAQSILFGALQSALMASMGDDEEDDFDKKKERILNGMIDSVLSGIGYGGKAVSTVKNSIREYIKQKDKGWNADHTYTILSLLSFSPPIGSKLRKIYGSIQTKQFNQGVFTRRGLTLDNPAWSGIGNVVEGVTNIPLGRIAQKMLNIDNAMDDSNSFFERTALLLGWNTWDLGIKDPDIEAVKTEIKEEKKVVNKEKQKIQKEIKKKEEKEANKAVIEENKKKSKKDGICSAISKGGTRCKSKAINGGMCTVHEKATQNSTGIKSQCKKVKSSGKRCGMQTSSKSGYCYYHD